MFDFENLFLRLGGKSIKPHTWLVYIDSISSITLINSLTLKPNRASCTNLSSSSFCRGIMKDQPLNLKSMSRNSFAYIPSKLRFFMIMLHQNLISIESCWVGHSWIRSGTVRCNLRLSARPSLVIRLAGQVQCTHQPTLIH